MKKKFKHNLTPAEQTMGEPLTAYWFNGGLTAKSNGGRIIARVDWHGPFNHPVLHYMGNPYPMGLGDAQAATRYLAEKACKRVGFTMLDLKRNIFQNF